ncbi:hypothetical protein F4604DRAFT_1936077 [Suillus subluteus]|nr:hypothetical protein F4604DRAFT_1936077 [Suillus subluteus]
MVLLPHENRKHVKTVTRTWTSHTVRSHSDQTITRTKTTFDVMETETVKERIRTIDSDTTQTITGPSNLPILNTAIETPQGLAPSPTESTPSSASGTLHLEVKTFPSSPTSPAQTSSSDELWAQVKDLSEYMDGISLS